MKRLLRTGGEYTQEHRAEHAVKQGDKHDLSPVHHFVVHHERFVHVVDTFHFMGLPLLTSYETDFRCHVSYRRG